MANCGVGLQEVNTTDHVVDATQAELGHDLPDFSSDHEHVVHHVLGCALKFLTQFRILCRDSYRTGI